MAAGTPRREENNDWLKNLANTGEANGVLLTRDLANEIACSGRWTLKDLYKMLAQDVDEQQINENVRNARMCSISRPALFPDEERELRREQSAAVFEASRAKRDVVDKFIRWCIEEMGSSSGGPPYVLSVSV